MADDQGPKMRRRRLLRQRDARELLKETPWLRPEDLVVEQIELDDGTMLYMIDEIPQLVRERGLLYPSLKCGCLDRLPTIVVDMGAVPFVCNGADLMAPGIVDVRGDFHEGELVVVRDVRHEKALSIGRALLSSDLLRATRKGKVVENIHYVGDRLWRAYS